MWISKAYAQTADSADQLKALADQPVPGGSPIWDIGLIVVMVALFYILLILPQQRRFKAHNAMLSELKKGDRVVTSGGLIGKIEKIIDETEVLVDLGGGVQVTALRSMIQAKTELKPKGAANDAEKKQADAPKKAKAKTAKKKTAKKDA